MRNAANSDWDDLQMSGLLLSGDGNLADFAYVTDVTEEVEGALKEALKCLQPMVSLVRLAIDIALRHHKVGQGSAQRTSCSVKMTGKQP